jgi:hypothetical protein
MKLGIAWGGQVQDALGAHFMSLQQFPPRQKGASLKPGRAQVTRSAARANGRRPWPVRVSNRFRVDATWRFARRHKLRALFFNNDQSSRRTLERELEIGDSVYPAEADVSAGIRTSIAELAYEYVFLKRDHHEVSASVGVHAVEFKFGVAGRASIAGQTGQFREESAVAEAPLPVVGLRGLWEFAPRWYLDGQVQSFSLSIDGYDGRLTDLRVGVIRMFGEHVGVGLGWNRFDVDVDADRERFTGTLDWRYDGAMAFVTGTF